MGIGEPWPPSRILTGTGFCGRLEFAHEKPRTRDPNDQGQVLFSPRQRWERRQQVPDIFCFPAQASLSRLPPALDQRCIARSYTQQL